MHRPVLDATARAVFCSAWASVQEEQGVAVDGDIIMDTAPPTSPEAHAWAMTLWSQIVHVNHLGGGDLTRGVEQAWAQASKRARLDVKDADAARELGHMVAMEALGTGEKWSDQHADSGLTIPVLAPESWEPSTLLGGGADARENPGVDVTDEAFEFPPHSELVEIAERRAEHAVEHGEEGAYVQLFELSDIDITEFVEIVQAALRVWPKSVSTDQLWVRVYGSDDRTPSGDVAESRVQVIELHQGQLHVRLDNHNEDSESHGDRVVFADIGNMHIDAVDGARDELASLGWTNTDADYAEPPDGVLNVTEARENPSAAFEMPSAEDLFDKSQAAIDAYAGPRGDVVFPLTMKDCVAFAELLNGALEALGDVDPTFLFVEVTATDHRPVEQRREDAGVTDGDPRELDTADPVVHVMFGAMPGEPSLGAPNEVRVEVISGNDDVENILDSANVAYFTYSAEIADELKSRGWDVTAPSDPTGDGKSYDCRPPQRVWQTAFGTRDNPGAASGAYQTQSIIFDNAVFTKAQAKAWAKKHGFKHGDVDAQENTWRVRQSDPSSFATFRTIPMTDGVQAVIGVPR